MAPFDVGALGVPASPGRSSWSTKMRPTDGFTVRHPDHNFVANDIIVHNSIEQDADTVFLLHRPDRYEPGQHEGIIEVIVAKQRNGPTGDVTLAYIKQHMRYEDFKVGTPFDG